MKKFLKRFFQVSFVIIILGLFAWTIFFLYKKSQKKPVVYDTETPFRTTITRKTVATGAVVPRKEVAIKPKISGIVEQLYVTAGNNVAKGDKVAKVKIIPDMVQLNAAESRLKMAKINFENARLEFNRQKELLDKQVISDSQFLEHKSTFEIAEEELQAAKDNLQLIREGVTKRTGKTTNTIVRSTIDGMVLNVGVEEGSSVIESNNFSDGTTIATIADMGEMIFKGKVDESEVGKIKTGMILYLTIGAIEDEKFKALLEYISPKGFEEQGAIQFEIKAAVELKDAVFIRAGYSATADIVLAEKEDVLAIKENLLKFENDKAYVEIETTPQQFEKREVGVGLSDGINIEVISGLSEKDKIKSRVKDTA